jgi:pimeloyl-ACP methyl ester carboxylesterase
MIPGLVAPGAGQGVRDTLRSMILANTPVGIAAALRGMAMRPDSSESLPAIAAPTLVIVGEQDGLTPPSEARASSMAIPGSQVVVIRGVGHLSSLESPAAFTAALRDFLGQQH